MSKIIIHNYTSLSDVKALDMVSEVIKRGRISGNGEYYCYGTLFPGLEYDYMVFASKNKGDSDTFKISERKKT